MTDTNLPKSGFPHPGTVGWVDEAGKLNLADLRVTKRVVLKDTADVEALAPGTVYRTANDQVGRVFDTGIGHIVQWVGTDLTDELPRDNAYPFPDQHFPAEVIWSPGDR